MEPQSLKDHTVEPLYQKYSPVYSERCLGGEFFKKRSCASPESALTPTCCVTLSKSLPMPESPLPSAKGAVVGVEGQRL